jgi:hypothetical protein
MLLLKTGENKACNLEVLDVNMKAEQKRRIVIIFVILEKMVKIYRGGNQNEQIYRPRRQTVNRECSRQWR